MITFPPPQFHAKISNFFNYLFLKACLYSVSIYPNIFKLDRVSNLDVVFLVTELFFKIKLALHTLHIFKFQICNNLQERIPRAGEAIQLSNYKTKGKCTDQLNRI